MFVNDSEIFRKAFSVVSNEAKCIVPSRYLSYTYVLRQSSLYVSIVNVAVPRVEYQVVNDYSTVREFVLST